MYGELEMIFGVWSHLCSTGVGLLNSVSQGTKVTGYSSVRNFFTTVGIVLDYRLNNWGSRV